MIQKETYLLDNIQRIKDKYNLDPELIQRAIFALGLVETLIVVGADFVFKGGSSLMLLNETPKRLSTDVDILVDPAYDKNLLYQKVGYLFEKHFGNDIPEEFYKECLKHSGNTVIYLECNPGEGKLNAKWKLMIKEERDLPNELF